MSILASLRFPVGAVRVSLLAFAWTGLIIAGLTGSDFVWAASDTHAEHGSGSTLLTLGFFTVNFLIFVYVLRRFTRGLIIRKLRERRTTIVDALEEARSAKAEADRLRREYEQKLADLADEEERLQTEAAQAAERERTRLLEEANTVAERAKAEAQLIARREVREAQRLLRREVADQAVALATRLIEKNVTESDNRRLIDELVREVSDAGNPSR